MSRRTLIACAMLSMIAVSQPAGAQQARPSTDRMTCAQANGLVGARGAIVLGTGGFTYDRFVSSRAACEITEITEPGFAPTLDNPQCFVGYRCREPSNDREFD